MPLAKRKKRLTICKAITNSTIKEGGGDMCTSLLLIVFNVRKALYSKIDLLMSCIYNVSKDNRSLSLEWSD